MNLLMTAPLCDSRGKIRYFIGAQVDVSGLVKNCTEMESLQRLVIQKSGGAQADDGPGEAAKKDEFRELSEMLNSLELQTVSRWGGRMHREQIDDENASVAGTVHKPRLLLKDPGDANKTLNLNTFGGGVLSGVFQHVRSPVHARVHVGLTIAVFTRTASSVPQDSVRIAIASRTRYSSVSFHEQNWRLRPRPGGLDSRPCRRAWRDGKGPLGHQI